MFDVELLVVQIPAKKLPSSMDFCATLVIVHEEVEVEEGWGRVKFGLQSIDDTTTARRWKLIRIPTII